MYIASHWTDYEVLDTGDGEKLERWGGVILRRPDPQVLWPKASPPLWADAHATYTRAERGGGWTFHKPVPDAWQIGYKGLRFHVRPTGFKHTGLFPEQAVNWVWMAERIRAARREVRVLNAFAYTGGATLACLHAGAQVTHVDAAKGMVAWARDNAALSGLGDKPARYLVDDVLGFLKRERRRGRLYDAVVMDPPSYGRGPDGQVWKLEDGLYDLLEAAAAVLSDAPLFFLLNAYTTGLSPSVLRNVLHKTVAARFGGLCEAQEVGLPVKHGGVVLPCGASGRWSAG